MGILELEDTEGKIEVVCFPRTWVQVKGLVSSGDICIVRGRVQERGGLSLLADGILPLVVAEKENDPSVRLRMNLEGLDDGTLREIHRELKGYPGGSPVILQVLGEGGEAVLRVKDVKINPGAPLQRRFDTIAPGRVEVLV
jgi:DNA polymerase-3 subunit alpha